MAGSVSGSAVARNLGVVLGLTMGMGVAPLVLTSLINEIGWRMTYQWMGLAICVVLLPPLLSWFRNRPEELGMSPDGDAVLAVDSGAPGEAVSLSCRLNPARTRQTVKKGTPKHSEPRKTHQRLNSSTKWLLR